MSNLSQSRTIEFQEEMGFRPQTFFDISFDKRTVDAEGDEGRAAKVTTNPKRIIEGIATKAGKDLNDVVVTKRALEEAKRDLIQMSTILLNHDFDKPVGRIIDSDFDRASGELRVKGFISDTEDGVWRKIEEGVLRSFSISWKSIEVEFEMDETTGRQIAIVNKMRIYEASVVSVPGMPGSDIASVVSRNINNRSGNGELENRAAPYEDDFVIPFKRTSAAPRNKSWDAAAAVRRIRRLAGGPNKEKLDWEKYARAFAYVRAPGTNFGDYKFPHHDVVNGQLKSIFRAVVNAANRLADSSVPSEDKRGIAEHLKKEYLEVHDVSEDELPETIKELTS